MEQTRRNHIYKYIGEHNLCLYTGTDGMTRNRVHARILMWCSPCHWLCPYASRSATADRDVTLWVVVSYYFQDNTGSKGEGDTILDTAIVGTTSYWRPESHSEPCFLPKALRCRYMWTQATQHSLACISSNMGRLLGLKISGTCN